MEVPERAKLAFPLRLNREVELRQEGDYTCIKVKQLGLFDSILINR